MYQQIKYTRLFIFHFFVVVLFAMMPVSKVMCNKLHDIIKNHVDNYADKSNAGWIKKDFLGSTTTSFCQIIEKTPELVLQADDNGFLPIDLLVFEIKKLGNYGIEEGKEGGVQANGVGSVLIKALCKVAAAMVKQGCKLDTPGIKASALTGFGYKEYILSPLGYLLSSVKRKPYSMDKDRKLNVGTSGHFGSNEQVEELLPIEIMAFNALMQDQNIKKSIKLGGVACINMAANYTIPSTVLHNAVRSGSLSLVDAILEHNDVDVNALDGDEYTPLMRALYRESDEGKPLIPDNNMVEQLIQNQNIQLDMRSKMGKIGAEVSCTPLEMAISYGFTDIATTLCKKKKKANAAVVTDNNVIQENLFHRAACSQYKKDALEALAQVTAYYPDFAKTAINQQDSTLCDTPLHSLLRNGCNKDACEKFLGYGADLTALNANNETPLHLSVSRRNAEELLGLFKKHAGEKGIDFVSLLNTTNKDGKTVVDLIARYKDVDHLMQTVKESGGKSAAELTAKVVKDPSKQSTKPEGQKNELVSPHSFQEVGTSSDEPLQAGSNRETGEKDVVSPPLDSTSQLRDSDPSNSSQRTRRPLTNAPSSTRSASQGASSNPFMKGALAMAATIVGVKLFFIGKKLFYQEKNVNEDIVDDEKREQGVV